MSSIKTTELQGDVSVGRNLGIGGNASVQGNATIKKNLKVEGWIDAKNIKGANKGIFLDVVKLREAYPLPHDGWWALVGNSLPAPLYVADGGAWVATGESAGNPTIDSEQYNEAVAQLDADLKVVINDVSAHSRELASLRTYIDSIGVVANTNTNEIQALKGRVKTTEDFMSSRGKPNGVAMLGEDGKIPATNLPSYVDDVIEFDRVLSEEVTLEMAGVSAYAELLYSEPLGTFIVRGENGKYYNAWADWDKYGAEPTINGVVPEGDKVYVCVSTNKTYRWSGSGLVTIGSDLALGHTESTAYPGNEGEQLDRHVQDLFHKAELAEMGIDDLGTRMDAVEEGMSSKVGNTYNVTVEIPLPTGEYYSDIKAIEQEHSVLEAVIGAGVASLGLQITFAIGVNSWKTYQYTGVNTTEAQVKNPDNWIDLAGMSAGGESVINVNALCGDKDYTLSTAVSALIDYEEETGIGYRKEGLVITYRRDVSSNKWECKQYTGKVIDMTATNEKQWIDFGGGGTEVETTDTIEGGNEKAVTSGAVHEALQTKPIVNFNDESTAEDYVFQGVNEKGEAVGDPIRMSRQTGGGSQTGSTLNIFPEMQAVWGAFGGKITLRAAIKSVSFDGDVEVLGTIKVVSILDATTKIELWSEVVNRQSSTSAMDFGFEFDFTDYITEASSKDFIIRATDADGNSKTRTITVTAVDVTCSVVNALNYTQAQSLEVGGAMKSIPLYKFEKNVSTKQGIKVVTEILYDDEWRELGSDVVTDTYAHNVSINPQNLFGGGEALAHAAYPVRVHGVDLASGVEGNTVYTAVMCVDKNSKEALVAMRYNDMEGGKVRLYDTLSVDVAAYTPGKTTTPVQVLLGGHQITSFDLGIAQVKVVPKQIQGYKADGTQVLELKAVSGTSTSLVLNITVQGSAIDANVKDGALFTYDFSTRTNEDTDHTIEDGGIEMKVEGSNYMSNGFCAISLPKPENKKETYTENALRIAENVKATIPWEPFGLSALETSGAAFQMAFSTSRIKDPDAKLCECYDPNMGAGFYIQGNKIVLSVQNGTPKEAKVSFRNNEKVTVAVVVEPGTKFVTYKANAEAQGTNYSFVKLFVNGEECAALGYQPNTSALRQTRQITFNSEAGDINVNYAIGYNSYMEWLQAFQNYLCMISDVNAMIKEYDKENVLDVTGKPSMAMMEQKGIPYYVVVADDQTFKNFDYALNGGTDTSDKFTADVYYFNPQYPCLNFVCRGALWRRQGTTSAQRPIKNDRFNFNKKNGKKEMPKVELQNPDDSTELGRKAIMAAKYNKVFVDPDGFAVDIITVKVDYSDSSNANDCGVCNMMNATFRALGDKFLTPAQRAFDGTQTLGEGDVVTGIKMDHSTKNHPIAAFRATSGTLQDAWFHAKGNWKEDKGEQVALGFKDTPGYNKGCLNYGQFVEFFGTKGETLAQTETRFKQATDLDTSKPYLVSQYCGRDYAIYRYKSGAWTRSTGAMKQVNGKWQVTGDVLNPVTGYELLQYAGMDWWQGVATVEDMMRPTTQQSSWVKKLKLSATEYPAWTYYFECMVDDDQLQEDLALGRKCPYDLFKMLQFMDSCDYAKGGDWMKVWRENAYKWLSPESAMAYTSFTDFLAAFDQRAKNMQPMFFLEDGAMVVDGHYTGVGGMEAIRMYLNKVYDCDTCNGKDNDGGNDADPEVDPNKPSDEESGYVNPYMGSGSVLFNNMDKCPEIWNAANGAETISLKAVVNKMRTLQTNISGTTMSPFSPDGALHFFVDKILKFWPKVVSSYDGERKYIDHTNIANAPYFYALHGLGLTQMPRFIEQRWAIRDGYYQTGDFYTNPLSGRVSALKADAKIYITAAKTGYFGIGNDASGQLSEAVFLEAGESHAFTNFAHDNGALLYIYQPSRMSMIDLSEMSLDSHFNDLSKLSLCEEIVIGGEKHTGNPAIGSFAPLSNVNLGDMPFLRSIDVSGTLCTGIDASKCPRLETVNAENTPLTQCKVAQTSPVSLMKLPNTVTALELVNLPNLSYPGGLQIDGFENVSRLWIEGCAGIRTDLFIEDVAKEGSLKEVRVPNINMTAEASSLELLKAMGVVGLDSDGNAYDEVGQCSGITGRWIMSKYVDDAVVERLAAYYPELRVMNAQWTCVVFDDAVAANNTQNITNLDNGTTGESYEPSGHIVKLVEKSHAWKATFDNQHGEMLCKQISDADYTVMADGSTYDPSDNAGENFDIMKNIPEYWYKGVNDFKAQKKYYFVSALEEEPLSSATIIKRMKLAECKRKDFACVYVSSGGKRLERGDDVIIVDNPSENLYEINVEGMRQVRWPGVKSELIGAVFADADGKVVDVFNMNVNHSLFDFIEGEYVFCDVPEGAVTFLFSSMINLDDLEVIAVDSTEVEAIEPDWVRTKERLVGVYTGSVDSRGLLRSLSGRPAIRGTVDSEGVTSQQWKYDSEGNVTNVLVPSDLKYSMKDLMNICEMRGKGYQSIDYEMSKDLANIIFAILGDRDAQAKCGAGCSANYTTGSFGLNAYGNTTRITGRTSGQGNLMFGLQGFVACTAEWMDNVGINIPSFKQFKKDKLNALSGYSVTNPPLWHIYDPLAGTERVVKGTAENSGKCIARVRFGRYCDVIASRVTNLDQWDIHYSDAQWYSAATGRVVFRAYSNAYAYGGLAYASANYASSRAYTHYGCRLAFCGKIRKIE